VAWDRARRCHGWHAGDPLSRTGRHDFLWGLAQNGAAFTTSLTSRLRSAHAAPRWLTAVTPLLKAPKTACDSSKASLAYKNRGWAAADPPSPRLWLQFGRNSPEA
jgi:hypothetical protein